MSTKCQYRPAISTFSDSCTCNRFCIDRPQSERSQISNRETCLKMLQSKLYEKEVLERKAKLDALGGEKKEIAWGSQIRNYVFQPYTLVKDTRTKYEVGNVQAVMDGEIDGFINAYLKEFG